MGGRMARVRACVRVCVRARARGRVCMRAFVPQSHMRPCVRVGGRASNPPARSPRVVGPEWALRCRFFDGLPHAAAALAGAALAVPAGGAAAAACPLGTF
eukprot:3284119-Alexandrium_andersonii.AAC.1